MLIPAQAALLRGAQDVAPGPLADAAAERRSAARGAVLPPLAEGQYEPMPATMTFAQFLSGLNPLQHIPLVGTIYRAITGDVPPTVMRVVGGFLLGGPLGGVASAVGAAAEEIFGIARHAGPETAPPAPVPSAGAPEPGGVDAGERLERLRLAAASYGRHAEAPFPAVAMAQAGGLRALP